MTDEERQRAMDFIVEQQAKFFIDIDKLNESYRNSESRFDRDEKILKLMIRAGRRARRRLRELDERFEQRFAKLDERFERRFAKLDERFEQRFAKLTDALTTLAAAQTRTDGKLDALADIVRQGQNGRSS